MSAVSYPPSWSVEAIVRSSSPVALNAANPASSPVFRNTPWLCAYWPRRMEARDGQQSGVEAKKLLKVAPVATSRRLTAGMRETDAKSRSSTTITTKLGWSDAELYDSAD